MASLSDRYKITVKIEEKSRDHGKVFIIEEMSAVAGEDWAYRAVLAMGRSGLDIPDHVAATGMAGVAKVFGFRALQGMRYEEARPLLDDLMACVQIKIGDVVRDIMDGEIQESRTLIYLKYRAFKLHVDFSKADAPLI